MTAKQISGIQSKDGSLYSTVTNGAGDLIPISTFLTGNTKTTNALEATDGSIYITLTDGNNNLL